MKFVETWRRRREKKYRVLYKSGPSTLAGIFAGMALALWGLFVLLSSYPLGLYLYHTAWPKTSELLGKALQETSIQALGEAKVQALDPVAESNQVVVRDPLLPEGHYLSIPRIGVDTVIWEAESAKYEEALQKGVWRVGDFAIPGLANEEKGLPIILAAHRFGYLDWSQDYRLKNSFYKLPDLEVGDELSIIWDQQRFNYRVSAVEEGEEIADYSHDLIMYTCKFLVSPVRIFVYAELVN